MINIHSYLTDNAGFTTNQCFGPFSIDGRSITDVTSVRSSYDDLRERAGIYGENHVNHRELSIDAHINPYFGTFPTGSDAVLTLKTSSGGWSTSTLKYPEWFLAPHFPWRPKPNAPNVYIRKRGPGLIEEMSVVFYFHALSQAYRLERAVLKSSDCTTPKASASSTMVTETTTTSVYRGAADLFRSPKSPTFEDLKFILDDIVGFTLMNYQVQTKRDVSVAFPVAPKTKIFGNYVTHRDIFLKTHWVTEARYDLPVVKSHGEIAGEAIATLDSNSINMFEFLQGLKRPQDLVPKLKNLSQLKTHAGNYLGLQYGIFPTISDLETLKEAILGHAASYFDVNNYRVLTAGHSVTRSSGGSRITHTKRVKIAINPNDPVLDSLSEKLRDIGGFPSINNLYELIPYSFVIDWFINVGDMLENLDTRMRMASLPIVYATTSSRLAIEPPMPESLTALGVSGDIMIKHYDRAVEPYAPTPPLTFEVSNELPNHWLEAGALIVTARK